MPRSARSAALFDMHKRPSSRKRVSAVHVLNRLGDLVARRELATLLAQPGLERGDQRPAALVAYALALLRSLAIDLALDLAN
jgi:hypothetical protein